MFIHVLSSSFHLHTCSFHFSLMSFNFLSKVVEMALWLGQGTRVQQMVIAKLSPRLSLNNPSNIWHCSKEICHKTTEREREREKKRKRASELDAKCYGNCRKQATTGWISLIGFARPVLWMCTTVLVYAKFNGLSCMVPGYRFWGGLSLYSVSCTSLTKNSCKTKVVFNHFDRGSYYEHDTKIYQV